MARGVHTLQTCIDDQSVVEVTETVLKNTVRPGKREYFGTLPSSRPPVEVVSEAIHLGKKSGQNGKGAVSTGWQKPTRQILSSKTLNVRLGIEDESCCVQLAWPHLPVLHMRKEGKARKNPKISIDSRCCSSAPASEEGPPTKRAIAFSRCRSSGCFSRSRRAVSFSGHVIGCLKQVVRVSFCSFCW